MNSGISLICRCQNGRAGVSKGEYSTVYHKIRRYAVRSPGHWGGNLSLFCFGAITIQVCIYNRIHPASGARSIFLRLARLTERTEPPDSPPADEDDWEEDETEEPS